MGGGDGVGIGEVWVRVAARGDGQVGAGVRSPIERLGSLSRSDTQAPGSPEASVIELAVQSSNLLDVSWLGDFCRHRTTSFGVGLADIDSPLEECSVLDADAGRGHVTG